MKIYLSLSLALIVAAAGIRSAHAIGKGELRELYRGARAQAMGNAFVAVADDDEALFYNPAGLAGIEDSRANYVTLDSEISSDIITTAQSSLSTFSNLSGDSLNTLMGKNVYGRASLVPSYVMPNFGFAVLVDQQLAILSENKAMPAETLGFQTTSGVQVGYAFKLSRGGRRSKSELRMGIGGKFLVRRGGYYDLSLSQLMNISQESFKQIIGNHGSGFGADIGLQYIRHFGSRLQLMAGAAFTEIGDVKFSGTADPQPGNLSMGLAARYHLGEMQATLAYDLRHLNVSTDWRMRNHIGAEFALPLFSLYAGLNQFRFCYGAGVDLWLIRVTAVSYAEELGSLLGQDTERRYLLRIAFGI